MAISPYKPTSVGATAIGALLILTGLLVPSSTLIESLSNTAIDLLEELLLGATLFKFGLVILGLVVIAIGQSFIWKSDIREKPFYLSLGDFSTAVLAAVIVAASALRLYKLDAGLWLDEILTYVNYAKMPFGEIISTYDSENQHFLYTLLAHASFSMFGESTWSFRLPAVLFGIGSIWALYLLGRQVTSAQEALLAAALLAFSYHHVWFSQNGRGYTGLLFWTLLASWLFLRALREARPKLWLFYAIAAALGVYTHLTMLFVIIGHFIIYLATLFLRRGEDWPHRWAGLVLGFCLAGLLTLELHAIVLPQIFNNVGEEIAIALWKQPLWTLLEFVKGMQISFVGNIVATAALLVFCAGLVSFARTNPVVIQLLLIPAVIGAAMVMGMGHQMWPRFFFFTLGFAALVVIRGIMMLGRGAAQVLNIPSTRAMPIGTALCIGLILVAAMSLPNVFGPKQDYGGALAFVEASKKPGDAIVTVGLATIPYQRFYKTDWETVKTLGSLNAIRARAQRTWLLYTLAPVMQSNYPDIMDVIQRDFRVVREFKGTLGGGSIYVCRSDEPLS